MDESEINKSVGKLQGYLGTFARNELENLKLSHYPSFVIVNLDTRDGDGSHWIAIAMFLNDVYICDSLGALMPNDDFPKELVNFLYRVTFRRRLHITRQLQQPTSNTCGLYCIFFIHFCVTHTFYSFLSKFTNDFALNDLLVTLYAKKYTNWKG